MFCALSEDSPFGILQAYDSAQVLTNKPKEDVFNLLDSLVKDLGISWVRWGAKPHKTILSDEVLKERLKAEGMNMVVDLLASREFSNTEIKQKIPSLIGNSKRLVKYWQIGNEPNLRDNKGFLPPKEFAQKLKVYYETVKEAVPEAKILMGGLGIVINSEGTNEVEYLREVLKAGGGSYFDIFDFHFFGNAGDYLKARQKYLNFKNIFEEFNLRKPVWVTETSTFSGTLKDRPYQSEQVQAGELLKRYIYLLSLGVEKVFWTSLSEWKGWGERNKNIGAGNAYFDHVGLIYDGVGNDEQREGIGFGTKKLSYYAYKKMVEVLEGSDWKNIEAVQEKDGVYIYKFTKDGKPIWAAWNDNKEVKQIMISGISFKEVKITEAIPKYKSGKEVTDYNSAFNTLGQIVKDGKILITLGEIPVFVGLAREE